MVTRLIIFVPLAALLVTQNKESKMLILTRKTGEAIIIDGKTKVIVDRIDGSRVRLAIEAPDGIRVDREEIAILRAKNGQDK